MTQPRFLLLLTFIAAAAIMRTVDHPWNVAPVGAMALFAGAYFRNRWMAFAVPILAMAASDVAIGVMRQNTDFYTFHPLVPIVYGSYVLYVLLGMRVRAAWTSLGREAIGSAADPGSSTDSAPEPTRQMMRRILPIGAGTLAGAIQFFLLTNLAVWLIYNTYPHSWPGLVECYAAALPFFRHTIAGDVFYVVTLFGGYELLKQRLPAMQRSGLLYP